MMEFLERLLAAIMGLKAVANDTVIGLQHKVEETTRNVLKTSAIFILFLTALLFILIGLAKVIEVSRGWVTGSGLLVVGVCLMVIVLIVKAFK